MKEKSWMYMMGIFFFGNMFQNALLSTGAFEIYVDDKEVFSKLKSGKMIESNDLYKILEECGLNY